MPKITRLVQGKKNPSRVNLYLDDEFAFALSIDEVAKNGLKKDLELTNTQIAKLKSNDAVSLVYAKIINFLSYRPRSVKEVKDRLTKYKIIGDSAQDVYLSQLKRNGYLDDTAFAKWYINSRNTHKHRSKRMLMYELSRKGVPKAVLDSLLTFMNDDVSTIASIITKKFGAPRQLDIPEKHKIQTFLVRQGFAWEQVSSVVKSWQSE